MPGSESNSQKPRPGATESRDPAYPAAQGFLVADAALKLIFANNDALAILTYPRQIPQNIADLFEKWIRPALIAAGQVPANGSGHFIMKLKPVTVTYAVAFVVDVPGAYWTTIVQVLPGFRIKPCTQVLALAPW
jgi:hypothetical protein